MSLSVRSSGSFSRQSRTTSRTIKDWKNIKNKQLLGEKAHCDSFSLCFDLYVEIEVHISIFPSWQDKPERSTLQSWGEESPKDEQRFFWKTTTRLISHFRITFGLFFKASPGAHLFIWKLVFICMWMKTNFHMKRWAPGLALKKRPKVIRKWPIIFHLTFLPL